MARENIEFIHVEPFIPANKSLPEITIRALILGILLAILLAASSTFVGLKIARTISGSIPAALISMVVLRRFRNSNILENNMVQTIASAGEVVATGVIFTLPALILMGYWQAFNYFQTALITMIGGVLGVMFSVPLRRNMVVRENLPYPEGLATAEVLKAGEESKKSTKILLIGSLFSAIFSFLQTGFKLIAEQFAFWTKAGATAFGGSLMFSPVLMGAGYIVGIQGLLAFLVGGLVTWGIGIPWYVARHGLPEANDLGSALALIQKGHFRYVGVGILAIGGIWCVISLFPHIRNALRSSFAAMKIKGGEFALTARTDRDLPFQYVLWIVGLIAIPTALLFFTLVNSANFNLSTPLFWSTIIFASFFALFVGFICAAIAAYIVGIVGTTSLPVSGIAIVAIIAFASVLLGFFGNSIDFSINTELALKAAGLVIIFATIVSVAGAVSGDNMQDLKAGQVVGSTPWKQQVMLVVGAIASALVIPFILQTTFEAYGIGDVLPRAEMDPNQALPAPQATLMATVAKGFFGGQLPWVEIYWGIGIAIIAIIIDELLKRSKTGYRFPPLLLALGFYLPLGYVTAFFVGGLINFLVSLKVSAKDMHEESHNKGILFASGLIAGEAILGAILTIPFAYYQSTEIFALNLAWLRPYQGILTAVLYLIMCITLYWYSVQKKKRSQ